MYKRQTQEVEEVLAHYPGVGLAVVYGVEVPGMEGRAGMAALELAGAVDIAGEDFYRHVGGLPVYARPVFLRVIEQVEMTGTFKVRKVELQRQGFDPGVIASTLYFRDETAGTKAAFEPYYETTLLSEATDPNLLYELQTRLAAFPVYTEADVNAFAKLYFDPKATQDRLYTVLSPLVERFGQLSEDERADFRGQLTDYARLYAFLAQVLTFADADLEKLYVFAKYLRRLLPADREALPREVQPLSLIHI